MAHLSASGTGATLLSALDVGGVVAYLDKHIVVNRFELVNRALRSTMLPQERLVLICLIQHIRTSGRKKRLTWVKQAQVADELNMPVRNVKRHMDKLEDAGMIQRWRQPYGYLYRIPPSWDEVVCPQWVPVSGYGEEAENVGDFGDVRVG